MPIWKGTFMIALHILALLAIIGVYRVGRIALGILVERLLWNGFIIKGVLPRRSRRH